MNHVVLDSGGLIALERDDRAVWAALKLAALNGTDVLVPSTALAQVWRGTPRQARLAQALRSCVLAPFDGLSRAVGELCGRTKTADICDAHVAIVAAAGGRVLYTSDPGEMRRLLAACGARTLTIIRC